MLSIIIPVYNEERTISTIVDMVLSCELPDEMDREVVIVNDASTDGTREILNQTTDPRVRIFHFEENQGKTAAVRKGFKEAVGDLLIIQDADLEYTPDQYSLLINAMNEQKADAVYGSRFLGKIEDMKLINRLANRISNIVFNIKFGTKLTDINTCFKLFKKDFIDNLKIESERFGFETEVSVKLMRLNMKIVEVAIEYKARTKAEGKKISWSTAINMFSGIFRY